MNIIECMNDSALFGKTFKPRFFRGDTWANWKVF